MASSVFFRFKSQKEPSRVTFDGTGISVFELKREIITISRLGDGTDFELLLTTEEGDEEYNDDTTIIPRSTTVIAKRLPAIRPGKGGAARYVSGRMPLNAKNTHRSENTSSKSQAKAGTAKPAEVDVSALQTEEERMAAVMKLQADQWEQQQEVMANATPVHRGGPSKGNPNVPDYPPGPSYTCHRCHKKGHWIAACPTNGDPAYDNLPRIKKTTGIPRSFLEKVTEPVVAIGDSATENIKQPSGVMLDAEGNYVIARPDKASWARYQAKAKVSAEAQKEIALGSKELQERGLECPIDQRLFSDPTKTPCCQKTYCNECITNALLDDDLQCPGCKSEGILIDDLAPDLNMVERIRSYEEERSAAKKEQEQQKEKENTPQTTGEPDKNSPVADNESPKERNTSKSPSPTAKSPSSQTSDTSSSKKRKADSELENDRTAQGPVEKTSTTTTATTVPASTSTTSKPTTTKPTTKPQLPPELAFLDNPAFTSSMAMPGMNAFMGMPMGMGMPMMMNPYMMNPMMPMMQNMYNMPGMPMQTPAMNGVNGMANIYGGLNMMPNGTPNGNNFGAMNGQIPMTNGYNNTTNNNTNFNGVPSGPRNFQNQQRNGFANNRANGNAEDSAYFRQPVNPHRHQGRRNVPRPTDYREI